VAADPLTAKHLRCPVGTPLLNVRRLVRDAKGRIIEYTNFLYRPDRYELHTMVKRAGSSRNRVSRRS
jgi:GntR family transcriptional regulator